MNSLNFSAGAVATNLASIAGNARMPLGIDPSRTFLSAAVVDRAGPLEVTLFLDTDDPADLAQSRAGACFVAEAYVALVPRHVIPLVTAEPLEGFRRALAILYPTAAGSGSAFGRRGIEIAAIVHGDAVLERDVTIEPGAVVGPHAEIGTATIIGANAVIGAGVRIGRGCVVGSHVSVGAALVGDRVAIHAGARIGVEPGGAPALGRVIIQDGVIVGANAVIERGRLGDTMIGEGSIVATLAVVAAETTVD